jgi:hypothetical protein
MLSISHTKWKSNKLLNKTYLCSCGKRHKVKSNDTGLQYVVCKDKTILIGIYGKSIH